MYSYSWEIPPQTHSVLLLPVVIHTEEGGSTNTRHTPHVASFSSNNSVVTPPLALFLGGKQARVVGGGYSRSEVNVAER